MAEWRDVAESSHRVCVSCLAVSRILDLSLPWRLGNRTRHRVGRLRRHGPAADGPVHGDRAAGRRAGARDQESAVDDPAQHGAAGRGSGRGRDAGRAAGAEARRGRAARVPAAAGAARRLSQLRQGAAAASGAVRPQSPDRRRARVLRARGRRRRASRSCAISIPSCRA